jgi:hypothetical protein
VACFYTAIYRRLRGATWPSFAPALIYNFVRRHNTLRCTPAMAAGVTGTQWSVADLVEATA